LITGGARGCGLSFAEGLAEAGADVVIFDIIAPLEAFFAIEKRFGVKTRYYQCVQILVVTCIPFVDLTLQCQCE
jgi:NAD(P)-dependent dehydrogenase (short-subunit alcohol dehydrogenase family)